jgi:hypothetical protein
MELLTEIDGPIARITFNRPDHDGEGAGAVGERRLRIC